MKLLHLLCMVRGTTLIRCYRPQGDPFTRFYWWCPGCEQEWRIWSITLADAKLLGYAAPGYYLEDQARRHSP